MTMPRKRPLKNKNIKNISKSKIFVDTLPDKLRSSVIVLGNKPLYCVYLDGKVLETPNGTPIAHDDIRAMRELAAELEYTDELDVTKISLYNLCCTQIEFVEKNRPEFQEDFLTFSLLNDPVFKPCAGPEVIEQLKYLQIVISFIKANGFDYPNLPQIPIDDESLKEWIGEDEVGNFLSNFRSLVLFVQNAIQQLSNYEMAVFLTVAHVFDSPILALMLAKKIITPNEFAVVYITTLAINSKIWGETDREEERYLLQTYTRQAECMIRYLDQFSPKLTEAEKIILAGESVSVEFKSTLRWNIKGNRQDPAMEHAVLKSIVAFLNTDGGTLLVGVEDDGNVLGIELDGFPNEDKYLLHFTNLVNTRIGKQFSDFIKYELSPAKSKNVLVVKCARSSKPVFLKTGDQEEFYVRTGPASVQLSSSQILEYSKTRFS